MNHCIRTALGLALAAGLLAACVPIPLPSIPGISRPTTKPPPISDRRIDVNGYCSQTEEDGFREQATLTVADNNVSAMQWQLWVGRRGSCQFDLSTFQQTRRRPSIELRERYGNCTLMVWQDPRRVTLAHANCEAHCTPGIYEEAWPVMFDPQTGQCARNAR
ncbi:MULTISPECIES: hypothetical protein [Ralstonia]|nr:MULTISPECIES: hypothetical protein [Ralstonia]EFP66597.1 hypothetical protein HMPREF1004_01600 [Ralstonia pickettii]EGY63481.1 hypothetical protein HMPREF0989_03062 [Ralstonia sp. 5_2_56FAA]NPT48801.1 hypothetical protein [Ralstonia sp. 3N]SCW57995.1 hypothetical protein SAMN02799637_01444 [Ralstonia sp. UNCCL144]